MRPHIVVVGSLNMDLVIQTPRHPQPGETITGGQFRTIPGGKGANQAVAAARMGGRVTMIGCVGRDPFGDTLIENLSAAGVDTGRVGRAEASTGVALITVAATGENTIVLAPGANAAVSAQIVASHADAIANADALLLQLEVPLDAVQAAVEIAQARGTPIILNPAPARTLPADLLQQVTYLIPNEHEAALLGIGREAGQASWRRGGSANVILTLGERGALAMLPGESTPAPAFSVPVVDTTAAGDAFVAAFAVALTEGKSAVAATRWGCAAGALACTVLGAQPSLPMRAAVEALLAAQ